MIAAATDASGAVQFVHRIHLTPDARNVVVDGNENPRKLKVTRGPMDGAVIKPSGPANAPLLHAEGVETALTAWRAVGLETHAYARALADARPQHDRINVMLRDDDPPGSPAEMRFDAKVDECPRL